MKNSDEAVEKVLTGLRDRDVPVGMESRILRAVRNRASGRVAPRWRVLVTFSATRQILLTAVLLLVCAVGVTGLFEFSKIFLMVSNIAARSSGNIPARNLADLPALPSTAQIVNRVFREKISKQRVRSTRHINFSARRSMQVISYPAPPLPLTQQEKLLLHVAHHVEPDDLKLLNPEQQAVQLAKINEEFNNFFGQVPATNEEKQ